MKRFFTILTGAVFVALLVFTSCGSTEPANTNGSSRRAVPKKTYYSSDGGKGMSLTVLTPEGKGLSTDLDYLPSMLRGVFVDNFNTYSAITVADPVNQEKILMEVEKGIYAEGADVAKYGEVLPSDLFLSGSVTKTSSGYTLQVQITDKKTAETRAAYSGTCTVAELDNFSGVKKASLELLTKLGVQLTDTARAELSGADEANYVQSQTSLARGVTAERDGSIVAALSFYSEAAAFNPGLMEAGERLAAMTQNIETGNIGDNIRSVIEQYNAWKKLIEEAKEFYSKNSIYDLVYNPTPMQGKIHFEQNKADIGFEMWLVPNALFDAAWKIVNAYNAAASSNGFNRGLTGNILYDTVFVEIDLLDNTGAILASTSQDQTWYNYHIPGNCFGMDIRTLSYLSPSVLSRELPRRSPDDYMVLYDNRHGSGHKTVIFTVDANRISDSMTLRFNNVHFYTISDAASRIPIKAIATTKPFEQYLDRHYYRYDGHDWYVQ
jgi:hypothetical protein